MKVYEAITSTAAEIDAETSFPATADPSRVSGRPCLLVELPRFEQEGAQNLCGDVLMSFVLVLIGQPGGLPEFRSLSNALDELLSVLDALGISWVRCEPSAYVPFNDTLNTEPSMAYEITIERYV